MKNEDLISIVIPVYNAKLYIERCWESLKSQSYSNLEFIFVDDCSSDGSYDLLKKIESSDKRVIVLKNKKNGGVSHSRNEGVKIAKGTYIGFCDSDDYCEKNMFKNMYDTIVKKNADICCCGLNIIQDNEIKKEMWVYKGSDEWTAIEAIKLWLTAKYIGNSVYTKLFKKELWDGILFPEGETFEEAYVIPQLFLKANKIVHSNQQSYNYFMNDSSITHQKFNNNSNIIYKREEYLLDLLKGHNVDEELEAFICRMNTNLYKGALRDKSSITKEEFNIIKEKFDSIYFKGLFNKKLSLKDKLKIIEVKMGIKI